MFIPFGRTIRVGRRSMCMGDDATAPNAFSFFMTPDVASVQKGLSSELPYSTWTAYAGKLVHGQCAAKLNDVPIFSVEYACFQDAYGKKPIFKVLNNNWFWLLMKHPYLYCD